MRLGVRLGSLMVDPFSGESLLLCDDNAHPWAELYYELIFSRLARRLYEEGERDDE